jgi:hypothetical protein
MKILPRPARSKFRRRLTNLPVAWDLGVHPWNETGKIGTVLSDATMLSPAIGAGKGLSAEDMAALADDGVI